MRPWLTAFAVCALSGLASAQQPAPLGGGQVVSSGGGTLSPGTLGPAVPRIPAAAPPAGTNVGNPYLKPYDPARPLDALKGTSLNPKNVVAPVTGLPGTQQPDLLDRLAEKLGSVTRFFKPAAPQEMPQTVTPGIFRRNRERNKMEWRRD